MKKLIFAILLLFSMFGTARPQWISNYSGSNIVDNNVVNAKGTDIKVDNSGNCFITGYTLVPGAGFDIVTVKFNSDGDTLWKKTYNGTVNADDKGFGIAVDNSGNVYVTGTACYTGRSYDVVLLKYNSTGAFQWARNYSASTHFADDEGLALALDHAGFIYVAGYSTDNDNVLNMATLKYDQNGTLLWSKLEKGPQNLESKAFGIAVDNLGRIDVTGYTTTNKGNDVMLVQYSSSGDRNWFRTYNNPAANADDRAFGIAVDESNNIILTGYTTNVSRNSTDCLTLKYNSSGNLQWIKTYNGGAGKDDKAFGIAADEDGSIYITGYAASIEGGNDYVTIKYTPEGNQRWVSLYDGPVHGDDKANAIAIIRNNGGNTTGIAVTGQSWGSSNNYDYATVKYSDNNGRLLQVSRYAYNPATNDIAMSVATHNNNILVTGYSESTANRNNGYDQCVISTMDLNWGESSELIAKDNTPAQFRLHQNYPNPFNPSTTIAFDLSKSSFVKLEVFDILGNSVATLVNQNMDAGSFSFTFSPVNIASGIYMYKLTAGEYNDVKTMTLLK